VVQLIVNDGMVDSAPATVTLTTENAAPTARAGPDQTVPLGSSVQLDGSASSDPEAAALTYAWALTSRPAGSSASLDLPTAVNPRFTADQPGTYIAQLIVGDGSLQSAPDTVVISTANSRPVADAGPAQSVNTGTAVQLDGSASRDADGDPLTYAWALTTKPPGSNAAIAEPAAVTPTFVADKDGHYIAQLIVSDGRLASAPVTVQINATTPNRAPTAVATAEPTTLVVGGTVALRGGSSFDPEGSALTYAWALVARPAGSDAQIAIPGAVTTTFVPDKPGSYAAQLIVNDGTLDSAPAVVIVGAVSVNRPPVIVSTPGTTATVGVPYSYDVDATDPDSGDILTYSLVTAPAGMTINPGTGLIAWSPTATQVGNQSVSVRVTDQSGLFAEQSYAVTVAAATLLCIPAPAGLVGWWPGDGSADDIVDANNGTSQNGASFASGLVAQGFVLDGVNDFVLVPDHPNQTPPGAITIEAWVRSARLDGIRPILSKYDSATTGVSWVLTKHQSRGDALRFCVYGSSAANARCLDTTGQPLVAGQWQHVAAAFDANSQNIRLYVNGSAVPGSVVPVGVEGVADNVVRSIADTATPVRIGAFLNAQGVFEGVWEGGIDEPTIYARALTAQEIAAIYAASSAGKCKTGIPPVNHPPAISSAGIAPQWTALVPTGTPPTPRSHIGSAYDANNDRMIVFGGVTPGDVKSNDVWVLVNATGRAGAAEWTKLAPSGAAPAARHISVAAYDPTANRLIIHGGCPENCGTAFVDTWVLTNANGLGGAPEWIQLPSGTSDLTAGHAYDPIANRLILFGGLTPAAPFNDTSAVRVLVDANGIGEPQWIDLSPTGAQPPPRSDLYALGYDGVNNRLLVFGGYRWRGIEYNDVWVLKNANGLGGAPEWQQLAPDGTAPDPRSSMPSHYDPNSNRLIVFGGLRQSVTPAAALDETWALSNANGLGGTPQWTRLASSGTGPGPRRSHATVYDPRSNRLVAGLGYNDLNGQTFNDAWVLANASGLCTAGQPCTFKATASDPDTGDVLTYALDAAPTGMTIDAASGAMVWTPAIAQIGDHTVTVRVTDQGGLFATQTFTATVAAVSVPNVVGLAPEWAESFITAADLTVGTKTSRGGAITLNFDSLPSRQGWMYWALNNPALEAEVFSVSGGTLFQNSLGTGFQGQGGNQYNFHDVVGKRLPMQIALRALVLQEEGDVARNSYGFSFGEHRGTHSMSNGLGTAQIMDQQMSGFPYDNTSFHQYRLEARPGFGSRLIIDNTLAWTAPDVTNVFRNLLFLGDGTGGTNARAEVTAYSFTQPRVVGQNPPAGTLVPNKTAVDLIIVDGPATETVPNVIGLAQPQATAAIVAANLVLGPVTSAPHPTIPAGQVSDQSPLPNIRVPKDTPVAIVMSTGPPAPANRPPVIVSTPVLAATAGVAYAYDAEATDPDAGDTLAFSLPIAPAGMTIDAASGLIAWTPADAQLGPQNVTVRVTDLGGLLAEQSFVVMVAPANRPPIITTAAITPRWTQLAPTGTPPSPRYAGSVQTYDEINDRLIVFGGQDATTVQTNEVWVLAHASGLGGTPAWTQLAPAGAAPVARSHAISAYDATANRLIVYGGCSGICSPLADAWVLTHANGLGGSPEWLPLPAGGALAYGAGGYDPISNRLVVYGGRSASDSNEVKVLIDANGIGDPRWAALTPAGTAPPLRGHSQPGVYDPLSNTLIVFGGQSGDGATSFFNDVWVLSHANGLGGVPTWTPLGPTGLAPIPRAHHSMAYDPNSNRLMISGGYDRVLDSRLNDTWVLTHANGRGGTPEWIPLTSGPTPAVGTTPTTGYARSSNRLVLALGVGLSETVLNDVWVLANASGVCTAGQTCKFQVTASDPDAGDALSYALDTAPAGMTIDAASGAIVWTPQVGQIGDQAVTVRVTDSGALFATHTFTATVAAVAVPNVVGLAPEWAESFITTADLTRRHQDKQGGAITLNFDSLPSRQGWTYLAFNNPLAETDVFSVSGETLFQNTLGAGFQGQGSNRYNFWNVVDVRLPLEVAVLARVLEENGDVRNNSWGYSFGVFTGTETFGHGLGTAQIQDQRATRAPAIPFDNTTFHIYRMQASPGVGYKLLVDDVMLVTGPSVSAVFNNGIFWGDGTGGTNARAETAAFSYTQPRVVGQNPPAGTLVPNKTAVDLTIVDGPATETVPNLTGLTQAQASAAILAANLTVGAVSSAPSNTVPAGQVSDQSPLPAIHVPKDTPVHIVMSTGPPGGINVAPLITSAPVLTATAGQPYGYQVTATDANSGDVLTFSLPTAPAGMTINPAAGLIAWTPNPAQVGNQPVTVRVTDTGGLTAEQSFNIVVANAPPVITTVPSTAQWTQVSPAGTPPSPRFGSGWSPYDEINDRLILFGGEDVVSIANSASPHLADVWVLKNATGASGPPEWERLSPLNSGPIGRIQHTAVYDSTSNRLIVHGGCPDHCSPLADTWVLTNANGLGGVPEWLQLPSYQARTDHAAGYDPVTNRMVIYGGYSAPQDNRNDVAVLVDANGIGEPRWIALSPAGTLPPARGANSAAIYDPLSNTLIAFGGRTWQGVPQNDIWVLSYANGIGGQPEWRQLSPSGTAPSPRAFAQMAYDPNGNRLVVSGGYSTSATDPTASDPASWFDDSWALTHANGQGGQPEWARLDPNPTTRPVARSTAQAGYNRAANRLVVTTGLNASLAPQVFNDAWILTNASGNCTANQPCNYDVEATDPEGGALAFSLLSGPAGMTVETATGLISWTPTVMQIGNHPATVRVTDAAGLFATQSFTLTVAPVSVPNVVGLAPEWAESFIIAADLTVGTKTSQGGAIVLNFDSLPSRQGWIYSGLVSDQGNPVSSPVPETQVFSLTGATLVQNSIGAGFVTAVGHRYDFTSIAVPRLPFTIATRARVLQEEGNFVANSYGFGFGTYLGTPAGTEIMQIGLGVSRIADRFDQPLAAGIDNTQFHEYLFKAVPGRGSQLFRDGADLPASGTRVDGAFRNFIFVGDTTAGTNARAEVTAYSFTQPRVVGQNPPAGTLVPNKTAVDLIIVDGPATETVPTVTGLTQAQASAAITAANLTVGAVGSAPSIVFPAGQVSDQSPLPNIRVPKNTPVHIVMSTGPPDGVNVAPLITSAPVLTATAGQPYADQVTATDANAGDVLTFSLPTAPAGMAINPASGLITWTPNLAQVGNHPVTVRVTDSGGLTAEQSFTIVVSPPPVGNEPPVITSTAPTTATVGTLYSYDVEASDPNADTLAYSLTTAPAGMTIDPASGLIQWTPDPTQVGNQPVSVKVQDPGGLFDTQPFTITVAAAPLVCAAPPAGLTSWWAGDGDGLDRANINHAALENGATFGAGRVGQALRFDGADDQVRVPNSRTLGFAGPFTVEFWFNPATTIDAASPNHVLLAKGRYLEGGFNAPVAIQTLGGDGRLLVRMPPAPALVSTTTTWPAGTWQHVAVSWDGARYRLYVNGVEEAGLDNAFSIFDGTEPVTLGNADGFAAAGFAGLLDEVSLYHRALGAAEIAALHGAGGLGKCTATYSRADAGDDQSGVNLGATVTLDAGASRAFDGAPLTYAWTLTARPAGSSAVLANPATVSPGFVADVAGRYIARLVVGNAGRMSAPDSVEITAANHPPAISSVAPIVAAVGSAYTYAVVATDPDPGDVLGYSLTVAPAGMTINASTGLVQWTPTAGQIGSHEVAVRVQDPAGLFDTQLFVVVVAAAPVPVAVPNVVGLEDAAARAAITGAALTVGAVSTAASETIPAGRVISQNPDAGTLVLTGSTVDFVVSTGPPAPALTSIRVTPIAPLILTGQTQAFAATGILGNGSSQALGARCRVGEQQPCGGHRQCRRRGHGPGRRQHHHQRHAGRHQRQHGAGRQCVRRRRHAAHGRHHRAGGWHQRHDGDSDHRHGGRRQLPQVRAGDRAVRSGQLHHDRQRHGAGGERHAGHAGPDDAGQRLLHPAADGGGPGRQRHADGDRVPGLARARRSATSRSPSRI
jgi:beta-lactam-binding protein with PASTA domain